MRLPVRALVAVAVLAAPLALMSPATAASDTSVAYVSLVVPTTPAPTDSVSATAVVKSTTGKSVSVNAITIAVRDQAGNAYDFPGATAASIPTGGYTYKSGARTFPAGTYSAFISYEIGTDWTPLTKSTKQIVVEPPQADLTSLTLPTVPGANQNLSATAVVHASSNTVTAQALTIAVRDSAGNSFDFPGAVTNVTIPTSGYSFTSGTRQIPAGTYQVFAAVEVNNAWRNLPASTMVVIPLSDDFTGPSGQGPNYGNVTPIWNNDPCWAHGCTNTQAQYKLDHATLNGSGDLALRADKNVDSGAMCGAVACTWASARLTSLDWADGTVSFAQTGGRLEVRMKSPTGQGLWPAFWTVGANQIGTQGNSNTPWPTSGEIDVVEQHGQTPTTVDQVAHAGYNDADGTPHDDLHYGDQTHYTLPNSSTIAAWHTFAIDWKPGAGGYIKWSVDGVVTQTLNASQATSADWNELSKAQALILNLAVGGDAGATNSSTPTSATMLVDYVRVYATPQN